MNVVTALVCSFASILADDPVGTQLPPPPSAVVEIHVDRTTVLTTSKLRVGITETHQSADHHDALPEAVARGTALTRDVAALQNTHIQGWGVGPVEPKPGVWNWKSMDERMAFLREQKLPIVITLCHAPGWMKASGNDWKFDEPVLPEHYADFAKMSVEIAKRYPDVRHFQVWNELKGFWNRPKKEYDIEGYTEMYNLVYDALKAHDSTLQIGGFYCVIAGTGSANFGFKGDNTFMPIPENQKNLLRYWTKHRHGADFVCADKGIPDYHDHNQYPDDVLMALTPQYQKITRELTELSGGLPVWWSEFYSFGREGNTALTGASYTSAYIHALLGGSSVALMWNPNQGELDCYLYTDVRKPDGGQPTEHYAGFKAIAQHFGPGTEIATITSTSKWIEVLASVSGPTLLVNKWHDPVVVSVDGERVELKAYEIRLLPKR